MRIESPRSLCQKCLLILGLFLLMRFYVIEELSGNFFYTNASRMAFLVVLLLYLFKYKKISIPIVLIFLYYLMISISTLLNGHSLRTLIMTAYPTIGLAMLMEYYTKKDFKILISSIALIFKVLLTLNIIIYLVDPSRYGEYQYFLGVANQMGVIYIVGICCIYLDSKINKAKHSHLIFSFYLLLFSLANIFLFYSSNAKMAWIICLILYIVKGFKNVVKKIDFFSIIVGYAIFVYLIIFQNIQVYFRDFIYNFFGKNVTFSGRTYIWENVIPIIKENLLLGNGMTESANIIFMNKIINSAYSMTGFFSSHNTYLQELYYGGFISLIPLVLFVLYIRGITKVKDECVVYILIALIGILFVYIFEAVGYLGVFFLGMLLYCYANYQKRRML